MKAKKLIVGMAVFSFAALLLGGGCGADTTIQLLRQLVKVHHKLLQAIQHQQKARKQPLLQARNARWTYRLEEKNYKNDYRVTFEISVKDGKIVESIYWQRQGDGESKTENTDNNETMKEKAGISPEEFIPKFNEELVAAQALLQSK